MNKVLITGGLGFIGSHAAIHFMKKGYQVVVVDNLSRPCPNLKQTNNLPFNWAYMENNFPQIQKFKTDIRNFEELKQIFENFQPDTVLHAAGQTSAVGSVEDPRNDFENNVIGVFNTLECARVTNSTKAFIFLSTNKVYGNRSNSIPLIEEKTNYIPKDPKFLGIAENFSLDQSKHTPYGVSKLSGDIYAQEYGQLYDFKTAVFRMSCIYGGRQFGFVEQGWISHLLISAINNQPITIYGDGKQVRDILYIDDLTRLFEKYFEIILNPTENEKIPKSLVFNIGGGAKNRISLIEAIKKIENLHKKEYVIQYENWRPGDQKYYVSNIEKVKKLLNWEPKIAPDEGISLAYQWLLSHNDLFH